MPSTASAAVTVEGASTSSIADYLFEEYGHSRMAEAVKTGAFSASTDDHAADALSYTLKIYAEQRNRSQRLARAKVAANALADMIETRSTMNFIQIARVLDSVDPADIRLLITRAQA